MIKFGGFLFGLCWIRGSGERELNIGSFLNLWIVDMWGAAWLWYGRDFDLGCRVFFL